MKFKESELRSVISEMVKKKLSENSVVKSLETNRKVDEVMASMNGAINGLQVDILKVLGLDKTDLNEEQAKIVFQTLQDIRKTVEPIVKRALDSLLTIETEKEQAGETGAAPARATTIKATPTVDVSSMPKPDTSGIPNITETSRKKLQNSTNKK
jgi:hypothetical protein